MDWKKNKVYRGDVWLFDPDPVKGREQGYKNRPCVIVSNNDFNNGFAELVIVLPCTTSDRGISSHVEITPPEGGVKRVSYAMTEQIRTIGKVRLLKKMGNISRSTMVEIEGWIGDLLDLDNYSNDLS